MGDQMHSGVIKFLKHFSRNEDYQMQDIMNSICPQFEFFDRDILQQLVHHVSLV